MRKIKVTEVRDILHMSLDEARSLTLDDFSLHSRADVLNLRVGITNALEELNKLRRVRIDQATYNYTREHASWEKRFANEIEKTNKSYFDDTLPLIEVYGLLATWREEKGGEQ